MEEFRTLQLEEKKVFLANLEGVERTLKEKEREADEVRYRWRRQRRTMYNLHPSPQSLLSLPR